MSTSTMSEELVPVQEPQWNFITRQGSQLYDGAKIFRWASFNVPGLLMLEDRPTQQLYGFPICVNQVHNPEYDKNGYAYGQENSESCIVPKNGETDELHSTEWICPTPDEQEDAILSIKGAHGQVIRTYTLGFGQRHHMISPGEYYEPAFVAMDHALALARIHRIRLVIPFINNHEGGDRAGPGNFGDYKSMCDFRDIPSNEFYHSKLVREDLKDLIKYVLTRKNTVNGLYYNDDQTILAWQLGNELGGWDEDIPPYEWTLDIANYIKSLAPMNLVMDGTMGGLMTSDRYAIETLKHPALDIFSNHYYHGNSDISRISKDSRLVNSYGKAFIIGEFGFGFDYCQKVFEAVLRNQMISGAMVWSLRYHSRDGGFYVHKEHTGNWAFHVPGFSPAVGFYEDDGKMAHLVRKYGIQMQGLRPSSLAYPTPPSAKACLGHITPQSLKWFGSAWAAYYQIYRKTDDQDWIMIQARVFDNVESGKSIYSEPNIFAGKTLRYKIKPVGFDGRVTDSNVLELGPYEA